MQYFRFTNATYRSKKSTLLLFISPLVIHSKYKLALFCYSITLGSHDETSISSIPKIYGSVPVLKNNIPTLQIWSTLIVFRGMTLHLAALKYNFVWAHQEYRFLFITALPSSLCITIWHMHILSTIILYLFPENWKKWQNSWPQKQWIQYPHSRGWIVLSPFNVCFHWYYMVLCTIMLWDTS